MNALADTPIITFKDSKMWQDWLEENHDTATAVFARIAKKNAGVATTTYEELREGALMYGWIDGSTYSVDAQFYMVRFTPRRPKGKWSKINRVIVEGLIKAGKMKPSGLAQVDAAKTDGRWDAAYDGQANMAVPADFQIELDKHPKAKTFFATVSKANRYSFLYRIQTASTPEARAKHIQKAIDMLDEGKLYHPAD